MQDFIPFLGIIGTALTVLGGICGFFIKYFLDKNKDINSKNNEVKREMYKEFVSLTLRLLKPKNELGTQQQNLELNVVDDLYRFYEKYILYSSVEVINSLADFMQYTFKYQGKGNTIVTLRKLSKVLVSMRKEVGLSNHGLGKDGEYIFRAMFKDFDELMKNKHK